MLTQRRTLEKVALSVDWPAKYANLRRIRGNFPQPTGNINRLSWIELMADNPPSIYQRDGCSRNASKYTVVLYLLLIFRYLTTSLHPGLSIADVLSLVLSGVELTSLSAMS
jgi:hypothetical protein